MKFAHISDVHLGFQKQEELQQIEWRVFEGMLDQCIENGVDFVLIPGDIFHVNIPEMSVQKFAFAKLRRLHEAGIPAYVVYGSHDFSPISNSVIDLLAEVGYVTKVTRSTSNNDGTISLDFLIDEKTGVKIAGLPGLKVGKDRMLYEVLDRRSLESESGFKIFLFHGGIADMKTGQEHGWDYMPLSLLPKGFNYYAGGHMHKHSHQKFPDYAHVVYPGTPFAGHHSDMEENARGQARGFVMVEFDSIVRNVEFVPVRDVEYEIICINAKNRIAESVNQTLQEEAAKIRPEGKIVIVKIHGEMTSGKTADVDVSRVRESLTGAGALAVNISKNQLASKEYSITSARGESKEEIETNVFAENIGQVRFQQGILCGDDGVKLAKKLLHMLGQERLENENKAEYTSRVINNATAVLGVDAD